MDTRLGLHINIFGAPWRGSKPDEIPSVRDSIRRASKIGYEGVEIPIWLLVTPSVGLNRKDLEDRSSLRSLIEDLGLDLFAIGGYVNSASREKRNEIIETFKENLRLASDLGARIVVTHAGGGSTSQSLKEILSLTITALNECIEEAENLGVKIGLENHGSLYNSEPILKIIRSIDSKCIGAVLDPVNMLILQQRFLGKIIEWPLESVYKMGDDLIHIHLFDYHISDRRVSYADPGDGDLNLQEFLSRLKSIGYSGNISIEYKGKSLRDPEEYARKLYLKNAEASALVFFKSSRFLKKISTATFRELPVSHSLMNVYSRYIGIQRYS